MATPMINDCESPVSLKSKLKSTICCFPTNDIYHHEKFQDHEQEGNNRRIQPQTPRSPYAWLKSTAHDLEIKDRCRNLIGRRGKNRKRHGSEDFSYDPESYSLNFEDDIHREEDELPLHYNFKARLPATPERLTVSQPLSRRELEMWS